MVIFKDHPCRHCGACCASFRVSFYWGEIAEEGDSGESLTGVPVALTQRVDAHRSCMVGTHARQPRCVALVGVVGDGEAGVSCTIYDRRSSTCREFLAHGEVGGDPAAGSDKGADNPVCTRARARYGLPPLPDLWCWDVS